MESAISVARGPNIWSMHGARGGGRSRGNEVPRGDPVRRAGSAGVVPFCCTTRRQERSASRTLTLGARSRTDRRGHPCLAGRRWRSVARLSRPTPACFVIVEYREEEVGRHAEAARR
jgi:hypothetical protein